MLMYLYHSLLKTLQDDLFEGIRGHQELKRYLILKTLKTSQDQSHVSSLLVHLCFSTQMVCAGCLPTKRGLVVMTVATVEGEVAGGTVAVAIW